MKTEPLVDGHSWLRIADAEWSDPLDPTYAQRKGGRWNAPGSHATLYLNEDILTARVNLIAFVSRWPYEPEDLRNDTGPVLVEARLPRHQTVVDVHTADGVAAVGLPNTYPLARSGEVIPHERCQLVGSAVKEAEFRGVLCRSANQPLGAGRELAWFPASRRSRATHLGSTPYEDWFWRPTAAS